MELNIRTILVITLLFAALGLGGCAGKAYAPHDQSADRKYYEPPLYGPQTHGYYDPYLYPYGFHTY